MKKLIPISIILIIIVACSSIPSQEKNKLPVWITNPQQKYNETLYLTAIGSGDTKKAAEENAYANIAKIFYTNISSQQYVDQSYIEEEIEGERKFSSVEKVDNYITIRSKQTLKNVKIAESYFEPSSGTYYTLAYLDRNETATIYENDIQTNNRKLFEFYNLYIKATNKLTKLKYLDMAIQYAQINELLNNQLRIISTFNQGVELKIKTEKLIGEKKNFIQTINIVLKCKGKYKEYLNKYLSDVLSNIGFSVLHDSTYIPTTIHYIIDSDLSINTIDLEREEEFVRWKLSITIIDKLRGVTSITFARNGREGHLNRNEAINRAIREVKKVIKEEFYNFFMAECS